MIVNRALRTLYYTLTLKTMAIRKELIQKYKELPPLARFELIDKINKLTTSYTDRDRAFICFLYLTGCRVEEVTKYVKEKNLKLQKTVKQQDGRKEKVSQPIVANSLEGLPITKKQLEFQEGLMIVRGVRCLKRKVKALRSIPVVYKPQEMPFITILLDYVNKLSDEEELFPIGRSWSYQLLEKVGLFPHYLRHIRLTHLAIDYSFSEMELQRFTGWTDGRPTKAYVHLNVSDLIEKMRR